MTAPPSTSRADGLMTHTRMSLREYLAEAQPYQRFLYGAAAVFVVSAVLHGVVHLVDDRPWGGQASWRQPMAFSLAFALVLPSLAWAMTFLKNRRRLGWAVSGTLGVAAIATVVLIAVQAWRGQPAFFPEDLPLDAALWTGIQIGIGLIIVSIVVETGWALTPLAAPPSFRWAIRGGLVLVLAGLAMGGIMIGEGVVQDIDNPAPGRVDSPVTFGEAGLVLFPHLLALHGLLVLSVLVWLLAFTSWPERRRTGVVQVALAGYVALVGVNLANALDGRAPFDLAGMFAVLFWISVALLVVAVAVTLVGLGRTARDQPA